MKEKIPLSLTLWKVSFPIGFVVIVFAIVAWDMDLYVKWLLCIFAIAAFGASIFVWRVRLVIDYENQKIHYYAFKKRTAAFSDIEVCVTAEEHTKNNGTFFYVIVSLKNDEDIKINCTFNGFLRSTLTEFQDNIKNKLNAVIAQNNTN